MINPYPCKPSLQGAIFSYRHTLSPTRLRQTCPTSPTSASSERKKTSTFRYHPESPFVELLPGKRGARCAVASAPTRSTSTQTTTQSHTFGERNGMEYTYFVTANDFWSHRISATYSNASDARTEAGSCGPTPYAPTKATMMSRVTRSNSCAQYSGRRTMSTHGSAVATISILIWLFNLSNIFTTLGDLTYHANNLNHRFQSTSGSNSVRFSRVPGSTAFGSCKRSDWLRTRFFCVAPTKRNGRN